jgi:molybdopterin synthase sulfur carrier subunit
MVMRYTLKTFGITRDILGGKEVVFEMDGGKVSELKSELMLRFPEMKTLNSLLIAVNNNYAEDDLIISEADEIALIPPVSGG